MLNQHINKWAQAGRFAPSNDVDRVSMPKPPPPAGVVCRLAWVGGLCAAMAGNSWAADLGLGANVSFSPAQVPVNTASTMTVTLQHNNSQAVNGITFSLPLGGLAAGAVTNNCGGTASVANGRLGLSGGMLAATNSLASCTITLPVQAATAATYPVIFAVGSVTGTAADNSPATTVADAKATLTVANYIPVSGEIKYFSQAYGGAQTNVIRGLDTVTYELTLNNVNVTALTNMRVPVGTSGVVEAAGVVESNTCGGSFATAPAAGVAGPFVLSGASIPAGGSCAIRFPVRLKDSTTCQNGSQSGGWDFGVNAITSQPAVGSQQIKALPWHAAGVCVSKAALPNVVGSGDLAANQSKVFQLWVTNNNADAADIKLVDPMPSMGGGTAGVIAKSVSLYAGSNAGCIADAAGTTVDSSTNTAYAAGRLPTAANSMSPNAPPGANCAWRVYYDAWNDGVSPNTSGEDPIVRTNAIAAGNAVSVDGGILLPYPASKADVTINPPVGDLGVTKSFENIQGKSSFGPGTMRLKIRLTNYSQIDALVVDQLQDDLGSMTAKYTNPPRGADWYTFVPGTVSFNNCGVNASATLGAGSNGYANTQLTVAAQSITIPKAVNSNGQTCVVSADVYMSAALGYERNTNAIPAKAVEAHYESLPLSNVRNTAPAMGELSSQPAVQLDKSFTSTLKNMEGVPAVLAGMPASAATLTVTVSGRDKNLVQLSNVQFVDRFPAAGPAVPWAMKLASNAVAANIGTCGGTITPDADSGGFKFSGGTLPAGNGAAVSSCTVLVPVVAPAGALGVVRNTLSGPQSVQDPNAPNGVQSIATLLLGRQYADLAAIDGLPTVAKSFSKTQLNVGEETTLKIELVNSGQTLFALNGVSFADQLPAGMVFKQGVQPQLSGDASCQAGLAAINGTRMEVNFAAALNITKQPCTVTVPVIAQAAGNLINTIPAGALQSTEGVTNPQLAEATVTAVGNADLTLKKENDAPSTGVKPGDTVHYTLTVGNLGPDAAAGATVSDTPPAGVTISGWTCQATAPDSCPAGGTGVPANVPVTVGKGGSVVFTVTAMVDAAAAQTNTATVMAPPSVTDANKGNNTATSVVQMAVDMAAAWSKVPAIMAPGQTVNGLTLTCSNTLNTNVAAASCVPSVSAGTISNQACLPAAGSALAAGQAMVCTMDYTAPGAPGGEAAPQTAITFGGTTGAAGDANPANNSATAEADVIDAVNDNLGMVPATGGTTPSVLGGDKLGGGPATTASVAVAANGPSTCTPKIAGAACAPLAVGSDGSIAVPANAAPGQYEVPYRICAKAEPAACDTAVATLAITATQAAAPVPVPIGGRWMLLALSLLATVAGLRSLSRKV